MAGTTGTAAAEETMAEARPRGSEESKRDHSVVVAGGEPVSEPWREHHGPIL